MEYRTVAEWLKAARETQHKPDGDVWTQTYLVERMHAEIGWKLHRENYSNYERGETIPKRDTLAKFVRFWARYDIAPPDLTPSTEEPPPDPQAQLIKALEDQTSAINELAAQLKALVEGQTTSEELTGVLAAAVGLAVRETLRAAGVADGPRPS